ncbi:MAG: glycoside hydrolase family 97 catalytic domain-containing protein [Dysgonamonadaceae bacterium]|jgi:alpha-glucosidase|nr:glycoside hydrolase family 97 catalytic domain-containing protein [Dysgonamonadaceae bacterium]
MRNYKSALLAALVLITGALQAADKTAQLSSPDGKISVELRLYESDGKVRYSVQYNAATVVSASYLGIRSSAVDFIGDLDFVSENTQEIDENYFLPSGKTKNYRNHYRELTLVLSKNNKTLQIIFRAYNDGVAYRYVLPGSGATTVSQEISEINIAAFDKCWGMEYAAPYEKHFPARDWTATSSVPNNEFCAPVLVKTGENYCLLTEAANFGDYCTSKIKSGTAAETGRFYFAKVGNIVANLPLQTPWRTLIIGSLPTIVESTLIENLNPPATQTDLSWIEPGVAAWDWAENDGGHTANVFNTPKIFIDLACKMGWKYFVLDEGWESADYPLSLVTRYAKSRNVKPIIWTHHGRFQNDSLQIRSILQGWKDLGFAGMKIDFWEDDAQTMMQKYDKVLTIAGELHLLVDLHGCTKPSGTRRFYPHLLTSEAVFGGEQYFTNSLTASHNVTLALTRNAIGSMDYTPMEIVRNRDGVIRHLTTWSHQLALTVLYESGLQCIFEHPDNILYHSAIRSFLKDLPAAWDEIRCLEASVDNSITVARRSGENWYVATISQNPQTVNIPLDFLSEGTYIAQIFKDGNCRSEIMVETQTVTKNSILQILLSEQGGATVRISKAPLDVPPTFVYEAENGVFSGDIQIDNDDAGLASGHKFAGFIGNGATITVNVDVPEAGKYDLTVFFISSENRDMYVRANNGEKIRYSFPGNGFSWHSDALAVKTVQVLLQTGANSIEFGNDSGWCPNVDRITLSLSQTYTEPQTGGDDEHSDKIKIACIGNSITEGVGTPSRAFSYPAALQELLGSEKYEVRNFGVSGFCMLRHANNPYWNTSEYQYAMLWNPDIVVIKLGTNDTNDYNWNPNKQEFKGDYTDMVNSFKNLGSHPKIYVCHPVPIYPVNSNKANVLVNEVIPLIDEIAAETESEVIDLFTPFQNRQDLFADDLHPNIAGARYLAFQVGKSIQPEQTIDETMIYACALPHDLTDAKEGYSSSVNGLDIAALFDNNVSTTLTVPYQSNINFSVDLPALAKLTGYSITVSDEGTGEKRKLSWILEGKPESSWYQIDEQNNVEFLPNETKLFGSLPSYSSIRQCKTFRLTVKNNDGNPNVALREWQLFGSRTQAEMGASVMNNGGVISDQYGVAGGNEGVEKLNDRNAMTKYCAVNKGTTFWIQYISSTPVIVDRYKLISGNDFPERDPRVWELQASNDGENWVTLDRQEMQNFASRYSELEYKFDNSAAFTFFRLQVNKLLKETGTTFQLAEWQLFEKGGNVALSPVPVNDYRIYTYAHQLYIQSQVRETVRYEIYDVSGRRIGAGALYPESTVGTNCRKGVYLVSLTASSGKSTFKTIVL